MSKAQQENVDPKKNEKETDPKAKKGDKAAEEELVS
jgi:hypothetical protein